MNKGIFTLLIGLAGLFASSYALPANLMEVYRDALQYDPTYKQAKATRDSVNEARPQARAGLLPDLTTSGDIAKTRQKQTSTSLTDNFTSTEYNIRLTQPIFDFASWMNLSVAKATVKQANAAYKAAFLNLITRVAQAYFDILEAKETLRVTRAEQKANARQLDQANQRFKVGLDAITSVHDAQASYDIVTAQVFADENNLENARERLREITGIYYPHIATMRTKFPLLKPQPNKVEAWSTVAVKQNYELQAAKYAKIAARENIKVNFAGHLPIIDGFASFQEIDSFFAGIPNDFTTRRYGLQVSLPIYQGGLVSSLTRQARADFHAASAQEEQAYRGTINNTHTNFNNVVTGIRKIKADKQAIVSAESSVKSNEAAFKVGTRTIVDLLIAQRNLYDVQRNLAVDQYAYINDTLRLKEAAGILTEQDLRQINGWLKK